MKHVLLGAVLAAGVVCGPARQVEAAPIVPGSTYDVLLIDNVGLVLSSNFTVDAGAENPRWATART